VRDIHTSPTKTKLLSSLTTLCKELRILPIGEGVETVEERDRLIEVGFDLLQGYHFAHPKRMWGRRLNS
jgi:EAL domain-containing protein (putative c-di-GMP-specific phosphodiesterase class I)